MTIAVRAAADRRFASPSRRDEADISAVETERRATREKIARLRALRLARDAETAADHVAKFKRRRAATAG